MPYSYDLLSIPSGSGSDLGSDPTEALCSTDDLRDSLGARFAARADAADLILAASQLVRDYCRRSFARSDLDETYDGGGRPSIALRRAPVATVTAVWVNGTALDNSTGKEWNISAEPGLLVRGDGRGDPRFAPAWIFGFPRWPDGSPTGSSGTPVWTPGTRNVRVQYTGGYATVPTPVKRAAIILTNHLAEATRYTGLISLERIGDYEVQFSQPPEAGLPPVCQALLNPYVLPQWY